jgi:hypothetical protein
MTIEEYKCPICGDELDKYQASATDERVTQAICSYKTAEEYHCFGIRLSYSQSQHPSIIVVIGEITLSFKLDYLTISHGDQELSNVIKPLGNNYIDVMIEEIEKIKQSLMFM